MSKKLYRFPSPQHRERFMKALHEDEAWKLQGWTSNNSNQKGEVRYLRRARVEWKYSGGSDLVVDDSRLASNAVGGGAEGGSAKDLFEGIIDSSQGREV